MRVAILIPSFLPVIGGSEIGALELARRLLDRGHVVDVLTPKLDPRWPERETLSGIEVCRFTVPTWVPGKRTLPPVVGAYLSLRKLLADLAPDVLNMHYVLTTGLGGQFWASRLHIPTVMTLIGMDVYDPIYQPARVLRVLMRRAIRKSDAVTCISTFVRDVIARDFPPAPSARFTVVPYGVDTKRFHPDVSGLEVRERYAVRPYEKLVLTVQRLYARKGVQHFIQAAALVLQRCPDTKFLVVGDGPERKTLEALAKDLTIADKLIFVGEVNNANLPPFYTASDLFAFHTFHEGLGIVLLEAISSGRSVVTTRAGGTVDIIRHGENGLIVPAGNHRALADAIVRLLFDEKLRKSLASRGRDLAEAEFDWDRVAERYLEVFEQVQ